MNAETKFDPKSALKSLGPCELNSLRIDCAAVLYFLIVFAAGFVLGAARIAWLEPRWGVRTAELIELPFMLLVVAAAARWIVSRVKIHETIAWLTAGCVALGMLLLTEVALVMWLRGTSINDYIRSRDPISGLAYLLALVFFAIAPALFAWWKEAAVTDQRETRIEHGA